MGFATLVYNASAAAAGATNTDLSAATDPDFSQRNNHYLFTESYRLLEAAAVGASVTTGRYQVPTWNAITQGTIFNANRALDPPSNAQWDLYHAYPPPIPQNEEFQVQLSNNLGAATEKENVVLNIITDDWSANLPQGKLPIVTTATFTVTPTLNAWSGGQLLTLTQALRGGVYAVCGAVLQGAHAVAFRFIFPKYRLYKGRKLRPGNLCQTAIGDVVNNQHRPWVLYLGEWGRFSTWELPQVEVFGTLASSTAYTLFMWLIFLGDDQNLINGGLGGGM